MWKALLALTIAGALLFSGCGGNQGPYRAECEKETERQGLSDGPLKETAIGRCEEALKSTNARPGLINEAESKP